MELAEYRAFTAQLQQNLDRDDRVLGLVAVGSMAERDYPPDQWSDHDFFVISRPGEQDFFRSNREWLPDHEQIVIWLRETEHGLKVVYDNGHLLEFAVFDPEEYRVARLNRYRVLFDRAGITEQTVRQAASAAEEAASTAADYHLHFGQFISNLMVGAGRYWRGERLSGHEYCKVYALRPLVSLLTSYVPAPNHTLLDNLSVMRRFEKVYPELGAELDRLISLPVPQVATGLLDLAERTLSTTMTDYPAEQVSLARRYLSAAAPKPDSFTDLSTGRDLLRLQAFFPQFSPVVLFNHFIDPQLLPGWWPPAAETETHIGGQYHFSWPEHDWHLRGRYLLFDPGRRLAFSWQWDHQPDRPPRQVDLGFEPFGDGSKLTLTHGLYSPAGDDQTDRQHHLDGWQHFLAKLQEKQT